MCDNDQTENHDLRFLKLKHLSDHPVSGDEFAGQGHSRTAQSLVGTILNDSPDIRTIGLEGGWGSGKSSVIEIAREEIKSSGGDVNFHLFTFDAWAHQSDPLRRSFLETFIAWLGHDERRLVSKTQCEEWLKEVQSKKSETETHSEPTLTWLGIFSLLLAPFLPIAYVWLSPFAFNSSLNNFCFLGLPIDFWQTVALVVALFPAGYILARVIFSGFNTKRIARSLTFLLNTSNTEIKKQFVRDEDPTSVEFGNFLAKVIAKAATSKNRILIVMDNLDRLPKEQLVDAWAIMRAMVRPDAGSGAALASQHIWLIVPYDRDHVQQSFEAEGTGENSDSAHGVIEKSFDLVLRVPPPIITHWREYFFKQLDVAFDGQLKDEEKHILMRCLEYDFTGHDRRITPRSIKTYINDVVSLAMQWKDEIPVGCIGFYVLNRVELDKSLAGLKNGSLATPAHRALFGDLAWQKFLTALHYNVPVEDADQVLIGRDLEIALDRDNLPSFKTLTKIPGFDLVLGDLVAQKAQDWASEDAVGFAGKCSMLSEVDEGVASMSQVWRSMASATQFINPFSDLDDKVTEGLKSLLLRSDPASAHEAATHLFKRLCDAAGDYDNFAGGENWLLLVDSLDATLTEKLGEDQKAKQYWVPGGAAFAEGALASLNEAKSISLGRLTLAVTPEKMTEEISKDLAESEPGDWCLEVIDALSKKPTWANNPSLRSGLQSLMSSSPQDKKTVRDRIRLEALLMLSVPDSARPKNDKKELAELANGHTLLWLYNQGAVNSDTELAALALFAQLIAIGAADPGNKTDHPNHGDLTAAHQAFTKILNEGDAEGGISEALATWVIKYEGVTSLVEAVLKIGHDKSVYAQTLQLVIERGGFQRLNATRVISDYPKLASILGKESIAHFVNRLSAWHKNVNEDIVNNLSRGFLRALHDSLPNRLDKLFGFVDQRLNTMTREAWSEALVEEGKTMELLFGMLDTKGIKLPAGVFREALHEYSIGAVQENNLPKHYIGEWSLLPDALQSQTRTKFFQDLVSWFGNKAMMGANVRTLFTMYPECLKAIDMMTYADVTTSGILVPLLGDPKDHILPLVKDNENEFIMAFKHASDEARILAGEAVRGAVKTTEEEVSTALREFADNLGIEVEDPPEITDETDEAENDGK